jgi:hypothetical protein
MRDKLVPEEGLDVAADDHMILTLRRFGTQLTYWGRMPGMIDVV